MTRESSWLFSKPKIRQYVRGGVLHLESHCDFLCATDFHVRAPSGVAVDVETDAGDVAVHGAPGNVRVETDAGDVHIDVPRGTYAVTTQTDAGDETVRGLIRDDRAARTIRASTDAGDITVEGR